VSALVYKFDPDTYTMVVFYKVETDMVGAYCDIYLLEV
jgi:hypothetical protein